MAETLNAKRMFDAVGHYGRGELFGLTLRGVEIPLPVGDSSPMTQLSDRVWRVPPAQGDAAALLPADEGERDESERDESERDGSSARLKMSRN